MKKNNQSAYPYILTDEQNSKHTDFQSGLTKRELVAAMAMQGILANRSLQEAMLTDRGQGVYPKEIQTLAEIVSFESIKCADELLKQLEKE